MEEFWHFTTHEKGGILGCLLRAQSILIGWWDWSKIMAAPLSSRAKGLMMNVLSGSKRLRWSDVCLTSTAVADRNVEIAC
jgi:hypothetical protein